MKNESILTEIAKTGDCEHLTTLSCTKCPLSKLKLRPDGNGWLSCYEAVCGSANASIEEQKELYKKAAKAKLAELALEDAISGT
jgi:hypothetical protein